MTQKIAPDAPADEDVLRHFRAQFTRFMMSYKFGIDQMMTKLNILREEFMSTHDYNPIEHVSSRLKTPESILRKAKRKGHRISFDTFRSEMLDIAGVRVTCSFLSDVYRIRDLLAGQRDVTVLVERDYVATPKPNGYQSLHLVVQVPVYMSDRVEQATVEVQIRTIAMDFWASLEHKIYYKYDSEVPERLLAELKDAADAASQLDARMERLHAEVAQLRGQAEADPGSLTLEDVRELIPGAQTMRRLLRDGPHGSHEESSGASGP